MLDDDDDAQAQAQAQDIVVPRIINTRSKTKPDNNAIDNSQGKHNRILLMTEYIIIAYTIYSHLVI